jgi:hypothetical protein
VNVKFNLNLYTFHGHETTYVNVFLSYSCWSIWEMSEVVIKWKYLLGKVGDSN